MYMKAKIVCVNRNIEKAIMAFAEFYRNLVRSPEEDLNEVIGGMRNEKRAKRYRCLSNTILKARGLILIPAYSETKDDTL